jgi:hypothetical protein
VRYSQNFCNKFQRTVKVQIDRDDEGLNLEERALILLRDEPRLSDIIPAIYPFKNDELRLPILSPNKKGDLQHAYLAVYQQMPGEKYDASKPIGENRLKIENLARTHRIGLEKLQELNIRSDYVPTKIPFKERNFEDWYQKIDDLIESDDGSTRQLGYLLQIHLQGIESDYHVMDQRAQEGEIPKLNLEYNIFTDVHPWNFLYKGDEVSAMFDLEFLQKGGLTDLASPLIRIARTGGNVIPKNIGDNMKIYLDAFFEDENSEIANAYQQQLPWMNLVFRERVIQNAIYDVWSSLMKKGSGGLDSASRNLTLHAWLNNEENKNYFDQYMIKT